MGALVQHEIGGVVSNYVKGVGTRTARIRPWRAFGSILECAHRDSQGSRSFGISIECSARRSPCYGFVSSMTCVQRFINVQNHASGGPRKGVGTQRGPHPVYLLCSDLGVGASGWFLFMMLCGKSRFYAIWVTSLLGMMRDEYLLLDPSPPNECSRQKGGTSSWMSTRVYILGAESSLRSMALDTHRVWDMLLHKSLHYLTPPWE